MKIISKTWLIAACLLFSSGPAWAQPGPCDPAALPGDFGSCQASNIDFPNGGPGCYVCQAGSIGGPPNTCVPNDDFCNGISGGDETNACRAAECIPNVTGADPANPSGCDYDLDTAADENCVLCNSPDPVPFDHCGNGICEPLEGETCDSCDVDCNPPGYDAACLDQTQADAVCLDPAPIKFITFPGPPYPTSGQLPGAECEDGDLCTDNVCNQGGTCTITDKVCDPDADFCCPSGCDAPAPGGSCREVTGAPIPGCDPDCYVPEECSVPTPTPTPIPTPPANQLLEGSGCSLSAMAGPSSALAWMAGLGMLTAFGLGKRRR